MVSMAKKRKDPEKDAKGTVARTVRLHALLDKQLNRLAELHASEITSEIRIAVRERLERHSLWPPPELEE